MNNYDHVSRKINPRENANVLSLITFSYTGGLFKKAIKRDLEEEDIYEVVDSCRSDSNGDRFERSWSVEKETKEKVSLTKLLWKCFGLKFLFLGCIHLTWKIISSIYEPEAIGKLVSYFVPNQTKLTLQDAIYYGCLMIGLKFAQALYLQNYHIYLQQLAIQIRTSFCSLIYRKALRLTPSAMNEISLGNIITVITKDVVAFEGTLMLFSDLWVESIKLFVTCYLIYNKMGPAGFVGIGCLCSVLPAQVYVGKLIRNLRLDLGKKTDERLQATQETLSAIKIIKMYTWETVFSKKVESKRVKEMGYLMKSFYLRSMNFMVGIFTSKIGLYALMMTYIAVNEVADAEVIFYVMKCFKDLKHSISILIPIGLGRGAELLASAKRISRILNSDEIENDDDYMNKKSKVKASNVNVKIKDRDILKNISTEIKPGLTVVTGPLGCGKSSLLKLFLRDLPVSDGKLVSEGSFSYSSQDPWLFPSSIKQNILFGETYDPVRYNQVVKVCALEYDFELFEQGDETIVADGGKNLSGGQQARINLARAVYKKSHVYLLDDPLHALDPNVQDFVYQNCIKDFLKYEYCVLVTHNVKHRQGADNLILMKEGSIKFDGKGTDNKADLLRETSLEPEILSSDFQEDIGDINETTQLINDERTNQKKVYSEVKKIGKVDFSVYKKYFSFGGGIFMFMVIFFLFMITETSESYSARLLTNWINIQQNISVLKLGQQPVSNATVFVTMENTASWTLKLYTGMIVSSLILDLINQFIFINFFRKASVNLHNTMIERLTTAAMPFYDNYFIGNILNRFSQDLGIVDEHLPHTVNMFMMVFFACIGIVALVTSVSWTFLVPAGVLIAIMFLLRIIYMPTARSLKRLESATRSPLIGHLNASMEGVTTIRASRAEKILVQEFDRHQDLYTSAHYMTFCIRRAFAFFMDILSATFLSLIVGRFLFFASEQASGDVGLAITKAATLASLVQWALLQWSDLENDMTSVERVLEYTEVPQEDYEGQELQHWPTKGEVVFENVSLTYKLEKVLKGISFRVKPKNKIGIVGRTGAGKSSIISVLFRLYNYEGTILVDGVNIRNLSLKFLRKQISIIPQDPMLFQGTIRQNIDPLNQFSDKEIWDTIGKVHMTGNIPTLDLLITDHGSNFSTGQRQLICLARAIIRENKVVVLDEATANMDPETEFLVQKTIADNFASCTVFIIAHRLKSVLDCDKILVMEKGEVAEFDEPHVLMQNENSFFAQMIATDSSHLFEE
ncbi:probable multidrug resistance-associated protein lethal(2)03659 [Sitophilus oryzae]|uniref:Probable multidrug resistance-associated protein lethal(2)03659 n=1 Tax=Sitophilus oryzae TaxID=7048 RepID=A0A6J2YAY4_SITOR|nr:probable multidrug resistance-associated protein lethal(2)03659 [Sitophilus oryzae]